MSIRLDFDKGTAREDLAKLPERIYVATLEVLRERMETMRDLAKINVRVETGSLRDSIRMEWHGSGRRVGSVRAGGYVTNPKTGRLVDYAAIIESKYPYMRPAWETVSADIDDMIKARIVEKVQL